MSIRRLLLKHTSSPKYSGLSGIIDKSLFDVVLEGPLRSRILTREELLEQAHTLAESHRVVTSKSGEKELYTRFADNAEFLERTYFALSEAAKNREILTPGAEWLLDNYHVIEEHVRSVRKHLPKHFYRLLPKIKDKEGKVVPRVYSLAIEFISHTDAVVDGDLLGYFVRAYQDFSVLQIGELWAFPLMLRIAILENLRRLGYSGVQAREKQVITEKLLGDILYDESLSSSDLLLHLASAVKESPELLDHSAPQIIRDLRKLGSRAALTLNWVGQRLEEKGVDPDHLVRTEDHKYAANQISIANSFTSLKAIGTNDWPRWVESMSKVDAVLRLDPAGIYSRSDFKTRNRCRNTIEIFAKRAKTEEIRVAQNALELAQAAASKSSKYKRPPSGGLPSHKTSLIQYYLIGQGLPQLESSLNIAPDLRTRASRFFEKTRFTVYRTAISFLALAFILYSALHSLTAGGEWWVILLTAVLFAIPASDLAQHCVQWLVTHITRPFELPKLDLEAGVPAELRTIVTVHTIYSDKEFIDASIDALEVRYLSNDDPNIYFAMLADVFDADQEVTARDKDIIGYAQEKVETLNQKYFGAETGRFFLFFRTRQLNESEKTFMGWERKRGKVEEFNRLLLGDTETSLFEVVGTARELQTCSYVLTLDADTQLTRGVAAQMISAIGHPLNYPEIDSERNVVVNGYGVVQPRIGITLSSANASWFSRIFCPHAGLDPYTQAVSDVYQDLFKEGSYLGKAIYHPETFEKVLGGRVPENHLLSHDLFEGLHARVALASDIELLDDFPTRYLVYSKRQHRWVRGDWQLLPWIFRKVPSADGRKVKTPISPLCRWKLIDNLRRSLLAPSLFLFLVCSWVLFPGNALFWAIVVLLVIAFPVYANFANALITPPRKMVLSNYVRGLGRDLLRSLQQALLTIVFLPFQAYLMLHAITLTLWRIYVSKRHLLEWETAYHTERKTKSDLAGYFSTMKQGVYFTLISAALVVWLSFDNAAVALPFVLLWACGPVIAWKISQPFVHREYQLTPGERVYLNNLAWDTWRYFDEHLTDKYNHLIPDNLQLVPTEVVAPRTSPTNIGLSVLSLVSAYDFGFVLLPSLTGRLLKIFDSLFKLERYRGHFYNWYDIENLKVLHPRYVSTVDSGNLVGHLVAVRNAFEGFYFASIVEDRFWRQLHLTALEAKNRVRKNEAILNSLELVLKSSAEPAGSFDELYDRTQLLVDQQSIISEFSPKNSPELQRVFKRLSSLLNEFSHLHPVINWVGELRSLNISDESSDKGLRSLLKVTSNRKPSYVLLLKLEERIKKLLSQQDSPELTALTAAVEECGQSLKERWQELNQAIEQVNTIIGEVEFEFLYNRKKNLFTIGFSVDEGRADPGFYDLLASEARLTSLVAVALGSVPRRHWFCLSRALTSTDAGKALMSWSGTMFEYLMPNLVMKDFPGTLLDETSHVAVRAQQLYAKKRGVPWGISESGYSGVDFEKTYQYKAFGVPGLGFKRGLSEDLVISPYSTALAIGVDPKGSIENFHRLQRLDARGTYGMYEAVDFTKERLSSDEEYVVVKSFLAHHQGMTFVALNNFLNSDVMQERFHDDPLVRSVELLLHEKFPDKIPPLVPHPGELSRLEKEEAKHQALKTEYHFSPHTRYPHTRLISNGRYSLMMNNRGGGWSFFDRDISLTRWRENAISDESGLFVYLHDLSSDDVWSTTYQPTRVEPDSYEAVFNPEKVEFKRVDHKIGVHTEITISPEDNVEVRRMTLRNLSSKPRSIELTSFSEIVLGRTAADLAHPAFAKMFIQSEYIDLFDALVFSRRPRSENEDEWYLFQMLVMPVVWDRTTYETSRMNFIGRGGTRANPEALKEQGPLGCTTGYILDPCASLRTRVELAPGASQEIALVMGVANDRESLNHLIERYHDFYSISRAFEMAWSKANVELRHEHFSIAQSHAFQHLSSALFYSVSELRGEKEAIIKNRLTQSGFWRFGVSGDLPIVLLRVSDPSQEGIIQELLLAQEYLIRRGQLFDLVILNEFPGGYMQDFHRDIETMIRGSHSGARIDSHGGVFLRKIEDLSVDEISLLEAAARVSLSGGKGDLASQLEYEAEVHKPLNQKHAVFSFIGEEKRDAFKLPEKQPELFNGYGGFTEEGYQIHVKEGQLPPLPWSNVIANEHFGFLVTEAGSGYTWACNSRENRLTSWSNDPVIDPASEAIYIRDASTGAYWCPTPKPVSSTDNFLVTHKLGSSEFETEIRGIHSNLEISGDLVRNVKWWKLKLKNNDYASRKLEVFLYVDWVLGIDRAVANRWLNCFYDNTSQTIVAENFYNNEFAGRALFIGAHKEPDAYTCDRYEFIGQARSLESPYFLESGISNTMLNFGRRQQTEHTLSSKEGAGFDSCAVLRIDCELDPGEEREIVFRMGEAPSYIDAQALAIETQPREESEKAVDEFKDYWEELRTSVEIDTPETSFNLMLNGWLEYQNLSCRIWGRSGFYQSGGAFGYRDQLQDVMALLYSKPELARKQIILHASRQFLEGDVQHWWHPPTGRGVRTKISDDYLWLPYVTARYIEVTGDHGILEEDVPYIQASPLDEDHMEAYIVPDVSQHHSSLYEHCIVALDRCLNVGPHGLPLIGAGDWNDGMNEVGVEGKGESVWLALFIYDILNNFTPFIQDRRDNYRVTHYQKKMESLREAFEEHAWDGKWYRRAFFDDGTPMGSAENDECQIDSLAQSWGIISGAADKERALQAMDSVYERLVREDDGIICLLSPPFDKGSLNPGYIKGYLPGVRENGGQYTHAAVWVIMATALLGRGDKAFQLFQLINPIEHSKSKEGADTYQGEPYVTCGDVYSVEPHVGRAGWSWYTGSAGWLYRVGIEYILGLKIKNNLIEINPCVPKDWEKFGMKVRKNDTVFNIQIENPNKVERGVKSLKINGEDLSEATFNADNYADKSEVKVEVIMG